MCLREGERESEREVHGLCYAGFVSVEVGLLIFLSLGRKEKETGGVSHVVRTLQAETFLKRFFATNLRSGVLIGKD